MPVGVGGAGDVGFAAVIGAGGGSSGGSSGSNPTGGRLDSVDEVGIKDEDLRFFRDIASVEYVNRYTTNRPQVNVRFGDVRETADVNQVIDVIERAVSGAYTSRNR
jgi:hypothetical protein